MSNNLRGRFEGALVGLAIGDALGRPFEFHSHYNLKDLTKDEIFKKASGNGVLMYTDDTLMAIYLAKGIIKKGKFEPQTVAESYYEWYKTGDLRGIGTTTNTAMYRFSKFRDWRKCGVIDEFAASNGTAMRVAPLALYAYRLPIREFYEFVRLDSLITHYHEEAVTGAFAVALSVREILNNASKDNVLDRVINGLAMFGLKNTVYRKLLEVRRILRKNIDMSQEDFIKAIGNSGYVAESVPLAIYSFIINDDFESTVYWAVKSGRDADTHGAIAGALAGCYYGYDSIPKKYIDVLESRELIVDLANKLYDLAHR